jgi:hypothetical protein
METSGTIYLSRRITRDEDIEQGADLDDSG